LLSIHDHSNIPVVKFLKVVGITLAFTAGFIIPALFASVTFYNTRNSLIGETAHVAREIEANIHSRPEMWQYETLRLKEIISQPLISGEPVERDLKNSDGISLVATDYRTSFPSIQVSVPFFDSGIPVGSVIATRSIRTMAAFTLALWGFCLTIGWFLYYFFLKYPAKLLEETLAALSLEKEQVQKTLEAIADGVIAIDNNGKIVLINGAAQRLLGKTSSEAVGKPLDEVYRLKNCADGQERGGQPVFICSGRDDKEFYLEETRSGLLDQNAGSVGTVIIFRDVSEMLMMEKERLRTRQLESLGSLAGGIAHDFNNLLQGVFGYISLAKTSLDKDGRPFAMLSQAEKALNMTVNLTRQLLTFSKGGEPVKKRLLLRPVIEDSVRFALSGSKSVCKLDIDKDLWLVEGDAGQLGQVIQNMVLNSDQAMPQGGIVQVCAGNLEEESAKEQGNGSGRYIYITISDNGIGIAEENLSRIFDPYFTTREKGSGLGLATSYSIIRNHGGTIQVSSVVGSGTTFTIRLPAFDDSALKDEMAALQAARPGARILIMDDEEIVREVAGELVRSIGHNVDLVSHGEEALARYREAKESGNTYDLVILDLTIRGGMGGIDTLKKLQELDPRVKAIVSSGYSDNSAIAEHLKLGFTACLSKPYTLDNLKKILNATI
jgi:PAS domain S-box-containing protein